MSHTILTPRSCCPQVLVLSDSVPWGAAEGLPHAPQLQLQQEQLLQAGPRPATAGREYLHSADAGGEASRSASLRPGLGGSAQGRVAPRPLEGPGTWPRPRHVAAAAHGLSTTDGHGNMLIGGGSSSGSSLTAPEPARPHFDIPFRRAQPAALSCSASITTSSYPTCPTSPACGTCHTGMCMPRRMLRTALATLGSVRSLEYLLLGLPDTPPLCISDLAPLSALTGLRCLTLQARGLATGAPEDVRALLVGLTRLRSLHVSGPVGAAAGGEAGSGDEGQGGGGGGRGGGRGAGGWAVGEGVREAARELPYMPTVW